MRARQIEGSEARMTAAYVRSVGERDRAARRQQATAAAADGRWPACRGDETTASADAAVTSTLC